jgi:hypothetical protein
MIKNIWKALFESTRIQVKELKDRVKRLEAKIVELAMYSHEPRNYKEKCDAMEERIKVLEKKTTMFR